MGGCLVYYTWFGHWEGLWEDGVVPRAGDTCEWPLGSLVWACKGEREKLPNILHYNINFLSPSNRRFQVNHKTLPPLVMFIRLDIWQLQHTTPARHVLLDSERPTYGTSAVAERNIWSAGKLPRPHGLRPAAPGTKVPKRGSRPQILASGKPGITATLK